MAAGNSSASSPEDTGAAAPESAPFAGRHAAITGGGGGIGLATAETLAAMGADISLIDMMDGDELSARARALAEASGRRVGHAVADISDQEEVSAGFGRLAEELGAPSILVNCAGIAPTAPFARTDPGLWRKVIDVDLTGAYLCIRAVLPAMVEAGFGRVVNIASTAGQVGYAYCTAYCAAKHGLIGLTRALALEVAKKGVTVNAVCPGFTDTNIVRAAVENIVAKTGRSAEEARDNLTAHNPQARLIQPAEVADTVAWLCLEGSASITGQSITVAGGEVM